MNKILIAGLIAFTMVAVAGSAAAWMIDIDAKVWDADVDVTAGVAVGDPLKDNDWYAFGTTAGVDGSGHIEIFGSECKDKISTDVHTKEYMGESDIYATQTMLVGGCLVDCAEEPCNDCPTYVYGAAAGATISGNGEINLDSNYQDRHYDQAQDLKVHGEGDFTAGMMTLSLIEGSDPVAHAMGAYGGNVNFCAFGHTEFEANNGGASGVFGAFMWYEDEPCGCPTEPGCPCDCPK